MRRLAVLTLILLLGIHGLYARQIRFVFVSDLHYGLEREFRGQETSAEEVNRVMAAAVRALSGQVFPDDGALGAGERIGALDFVICGGDIANRMEKGVQTAAESWAQFARTWLAEGMPRMWLLPGNHDISNAIGYTRELSPARDATCAAEIYNRTMQPREAVTATTFRYDEDRVVRVFDCAGVRFALVGIWPDSKARKGLDSLLKGEAPCLLFTHMPPEAEAERFTNPRGRHTINRTDGFENLICDTCSVDAAGSPRREYGRLAAFLKEHPSIRVWFHGHTNYQEYYRWTGPEGDLSLPVFRVDSPMKGEISGEEERQLSFQVVCLESESLEMSVREYRWNDPEQRWGSCVQLRLQASDGQ